MNRSTFDRLLMYILCGVVMFLVVFTVREQIEIRELRVVVNEPPPVSQPAPVKSTFVHHVDLVARNEATAGMKLSRLAQLIVKEEGVRSSVYLDTVGNPTVGVGRNLKGNGISLAELIAINPNPDLHTVIREAEVRNGRIYLPNIVVAQKVLPNPLTDADIHLLLTDDLKNTVSEAKSIFKNWDTIDEPRREAILDLLFNLGVTHFKTFVKFIAAVQSDKWDEASRELLLSVAARQNPTRYLHLYHVVQTGDEKYFEK